MFKTYKVPIQLNETSKNRIQEIQRQYSIMTRFAYNRFMEGLSEKDIRLLSKNLGSIADLNSWLIQCAILDAKAVFTRFNQEKTKVIEVIDGKKVSRTEVRLKKKQILFGGKGNLSRLHKGLISKEEFKLNRLRPIDIQGELIHNGNRMFNLKIQDENKLVFKLNRKEHIEIPLPNLKKNWLNSLWKMEHLASQKQVAYSIKLTSDHAYISFDNKLTESTKHIENRCIGIDLNPNFIGVSVLEFDQDKTFKVLDSKMYDIQLLTGRSGKSSGHKISKHLHNKLKHETVEITKSILGIAKAWNIKFIYVEDLNFKQGDSGNGKGFNRLTKNKWLKTLFQEQLKKRTDLFGFRTFYVNPVYSSVIGNLQHDYVDPVNAAIEIGRRGHEVIILKTKRFYPKVWVKDSLKELWKQTSGESPKVWAEIFKWLKNSGVRCRVSLEECSHSARVFSLNSKRSKAFLYCFG